MVSSARTFKRQFLCIFECGVRMAERSKAPDSRADLALIWVFWSTYVGVGSNPTSDTSFFPSDFFSFFRYCSSSQSYCHFFRTIPVGDAPGMELRLIDDAFVKICDMVNDCSVSVRTEAARFLVRNRNETLQQLFLNHKLFQAHTCTVFSFRVIFTIFL